MGVISSGVRAIVVQQGKTHVGRPFLGPVLGVDGVLVQKGRFGVGLVGFYVFARVVQVITVPFLQAHFLRLVGQALQASGKLVAGMEAFLRGAARGDDNGAVGRIGPIDSHGRGILQHFDALDKLRDDTVQVSHTHAVHDKHRLKTGDDACASDMDGGNHSRLTGCGDHFYTRFPGLQQFQGVGRKGTDVLKGIGRGLGKGQNRAGQKEQ